MMPGMQEFTVERRYNHGRRYYIINGRRYEPVAVYTVKQQGVFAAEFFFEEDLSFFHYDNAYWSITRSSNWFSKTKLQLVSVKTGLVMARLEFAMFSDRVKVVLGEQAYHFGALANADLRSVVFNWERAGLWNVADPAVQMGYALKLPRNNRGTMNFYCESVNGVAVLSKYNDYLLLFTGLYCFERLFWRRCRD